MHTLSLAVLGECIPRAELAGTNAAFAIMYKLGGVGGLLVAGGAMDLACPHGLMLILAPIAAAYLGIIAILGLSAHVSDSAITSRRCDSGV